MSDSTHLSEEPAKEPQAGSTEPAPPTPAPADGGADEELIALGAGFDFTDPNSPLAPLYLRTSHVIFIGFLALFVAVFTYFPVFHTDVWAHLRFGKEIVQQRWPKHEPFPESFADKEPQYIHYQWVAQAGAYLVYAAGAALAPADPLGGGALFLTTAHALIVALRFVLLYLAFHRLTRSPTIALIGVVLVCLMGAGVHLWIIRPQILGELAFAALLVPLSRPLLSRRAIFLIPLVFLIWANCHGTFVFGFILLGAVAAGRAIEVAWPNPSLALRACVSDPQLRRLSWVIGLSIAATMVNPHGPYLLLNSYRLSQNPNIATMEEWKPLPLHSAVHVVFFASVVLLAIVLRLSPRRFSPTEVLLLAGFGLQSVAHARMVVWWIMVYAWVIVPHLQAIAQRFPKRFAWVEDRSVPSLLKTIAAVVVAGAFLAWSEPARWLITKEPPKGENRVTAVTPIHVLDDIVKSNAVNGPRPHVIFASETLGDYLLWDLGQRSFPESVRLSCYTHVHLFTKEHWDRCLQVKFASRDWQKVLDQMGADFLVLEESLYSQEQGNRASSVSNLIEKVREASGPQGTWEVLSKDSDPVFIAQRRVAPAGR
jgi:hypothetical protein